MSIDAMLDMEREEVLALLENKQSGSSGGGMRSSSPYTNAPRSPVRSMLDVGDDDTGSAHRQTSPGPQPPVRSMLDIDGAAPRAAPVRSMLDVGGPAAMRPSSQTRLSYNRSTPSSPTMGQASLYKGSSQPPSSRLHPRSSSDAAFKPADFGARKSVLAGGNDRTSEYQFSHILPSSASGNLLGKRASQSSSKRPSGGSSLVDALRGYDFSGLQLPSRARNSSANRPGYHQSKSPHNRWNDRSKSPAVPRDPNQVMLGDGRIVDMNNAYRRLSDANLAFSSGSLSQLPMRKRSDDAGAGRLVKDYLGPDGEHLDSSDDDEQFSSDDEDRGRKKAPRSLNPDAKGETDDESRSRSGGGKRAPLSLLAAADEDRSNIASRQSYQYRSLLEPEINVTNASGETVKASKVGVHPHTSYVHNPMSATQSVVDSDDEADVDDIKRAQKLSFTMTNVLHNPEAHRSIRIIYRGEYHKITQTAEDEHRRLRKYLVATDLSDESTHALEWAIGTVIRDGDTLIAINCVDEETGVTGEGGQVPDDPAAMREQAAAIHTVTNTKMTPAPLSPVSEFRKLHRRDDSSGTAGSQSPVPPPSRGGTAGGSGHGDQSKAEEERERAIQSMTDKILRLLRKTKLQVRVIVEVLHCKNPRHLITEVIDLVNPTLVVIGSRGRSALKG